MNSFKRLVAALGATAATVSLAVLMPAYAWAAEHPGLVAAGSEIARRRRTRGSGGSGVFACGAICCLLVVAIIVIVALLVVRRRRSRGPGAGAY